MAISKHSVTIEDVGGSFKRFVREAPKLTKKMIGTAVFTTSRRVLDAMENTAPVGPAGQGLTPDRHIRQDFEETWNARSPLSARIGIFNDPQQAAVALFNEYKPNEQPFMETALMSQEKLFHAEVTAALKRLEMQFAQGARTTPGSRG